MLRAHMGLLLEATQPVLEGTSVGRELAGLAQVLVALALVIALAYAVLRLLARRGFGTLGPGPIQVEQRVFLDTHNALLVVQVEGRRLLLASHRGAPARLITELERPGPAPMERNSPEQAGSIGSAQPNGPDA